MFLGKRICGGVIMFKSSVISNKILPPRRTFLVIALLLLFFSMNVFAGDTNINYGSEYSFNGTSITQQNSVDTLTSNSFVSVFSNGGDGGSGTAIIGVVSDTDVITYGTAVVFNAGYSDSIYVSALDATHFVVVYGDAGNSYHGTAIIGVVSSTNVITFGSEYVFNEANTKYTNVSALDATHFVVVGKDDGGDDYGIAVVGTVSDNNVINYGNEYIFRSLGTNTNDVTALNSSTFVISYQDNSSTYDVRAIVGVVSDTNVITYGTEFVIDNTLNSNLISVSALDTTHFVTSFKNGTGNKGKAVVGTVSDTNVITIGTPVIFNDASTNYVDVFAFNSSKFVVSYQDVGNSYHGTAIIGVVSDTDVITFGSEYVFNEATTKYNTSSTFDENSFVVTYKDDGGDDYGMAVIGTNTIPDTTAPVTTLLTDGSLTEWNSGSVDFNLTCSDDASGCNSTSYRLDSGAWVNYTVPVTISTDGNHQIDYNSTDAIGNIEATSIRNIAVDTNDPYTTFTQINGIVDGWNSGSVDFNLSCSDSNSGCASTQYRLDRGAWVNYTTDVTLSTDGNHQIDYNSTDVAGNIETTKTSYIAIGVLTADFNYTTTGSTFDFNDLSTGTSLITYWKWDYNGTNFSYDQNSTIDLNWNIDYNIGLFITDGNLVTYTLSDTNWQIVRLTDSTSPTFVSIDNNNTWRNSDTNLIINGVDWNVSGKDFARCDVNNTGWLDMNVLGNNLYCLFTQDGNNEIKVSLRDLAGNDTNFTTYGLKDVNATQVDIYNENEWFNTDFNMFFDVNYSISGKLLAQYRLDGGAWQDFNADNNVFFATDGNYVLDYNFVNNAGWINTGTTYALLDKTNPVIYSISPVSGSSTPSSILSFDVNDLSLASILVSLNSTITTASLSDCSNTGTIWSCTYILTTLIGNNTNDLNITAIDGASNSLSNILSFYSQEQSGDNAGGGGGDNPVSDTNSFTIISPTDPSITLNVLENDFTEYSFLTNNNLNIARPIEFIISPNCVDYFVLDEPFTFDALGEKEFGLNVYARDLNVREKLLCNVKLSDGFLEKTFFFEVNVVETPVITSLFDSLKQEVSGLGISLWMFLSIILWVINLLLLFLFKSKYLFLFFSILLFVFMIYFIL